MNKLIRALLVLLVTVSGPAPAAEVDANIGLVCATPPCLLADETSIVLELSRSFSVWKKQ